MSPVEGAAVDLLQYLMFSSWSVLGDEDDEELLAQIEHDFGTQIAAKAKPLLDALVEASPHDSFVALINARATGDGNPQLHN